MQSKPGGTAITKRTYTIETRLMRDFWWLSFMQLGCVWERVRTSGVHSTKVTLTVRECVIVIASCTARDIVLAFEIREMDMHLAWPQHDRQSISLASESLARTNSVLHRHPCANYDNEVRARFLSLHIFKEILVCWILELHDQYLNRPLLLKLCGTNSRIIYRNYTKSDVSCCRLWDQTAGLLL
jgi:hypothetical protein